MDDEASRAPDAALDVIRRTFTACLIYAVFLSFFINALQLTVPLFMLQVQERAVASRSYDTLTMLVVIAVGALTIYGILEFVRSLTFQVMAATAARRLNLPALQASVTNALENGTPAAAQAIRDLGDIRSFMTSHSIAMPLEVAWSPIFLVVLFVLHPIYGLIGIVSSVILLVLAVLSDVATRAVLKEANAAAVDNANDVAASLRQAEAIEAMGMLPALARRWRGKQAALADLLERGNRRGKLFLAVTRSARLMMQMSVYAVGATLTIEHSASAGSTIAASILIGRLLAPMEGLVTDWRQWVFTAAAWRRVQTLLKEAPTRRQTLAAAPVAGDLVLEKVVYAPPGAEAPVIKGVSLALEPGEVLGIVGPSGAGKSTLARLMVGVLRPGLGGAYLGGSNLYLWDRGSLGQVVGYLPQSVSLLDGTIAENIARMGEPDPKAVLAAARCAGVHDLIGRLPRGYDTRIADGDFKLSGGQRQRIGLARAVYGLPRLVVLDEPNANLDQDGERSLLRTIRALKEDGAIVVLIAHRPSVMEVVDKLLVLADGRVQQFGPRSAIAGYITPGGGGVATPARPAAALREGQRA